MFVGNFYLVLKFCMFTAKNISLNPAVYSLNSKSGINVISPVNRRQERKNEITEAADDACFCLPAAGAVPSGAGVSITDMIASHLIHSSYRVFHPA